MGLVEGRAAAAEALRNYTLRKQLPNVTISTASALYMAQGMRCFHCTGFMPIFAKRLAPSAPSREHAVPNGTAPDEQIRRALLLAHRLCNEARGDRPLTAGEWQRAAEIWTAADRHWLEAGGTNSPFLRWVDMAHRMHKEAAWATRS